MKNQTKKILSALISLSIVLSMTACGNQSTNNANDTITSTTTSKITTTTSTEVTSTEEPEQKEYSTTYGSQLDRYINMPIYYYEVTINGESSDYVGNIDAIIEQFKEAGNKVEVTNKELIIDNTFGYALDNYFDGNWISKADLDANGVDLSSYPDCNYMYAGQRNVNGSIVEEDGLMLLLQINTLNEDSFTLFPITVETMSNYVHSEGQSMKICADYLKKIMK